MDNSLYEINAISQNPKTKEVYLNFTERPCLNLKRCYNTLDVWRSGGDVLIYWIIKFKDYKALRDRDGEIIEILPSVDALGNIKKPSDWTRRNQI